MSKYGLEMNGGKLGDVSVKYDSMDELKNEVEKELRYFQESDEEKIEITVEK